MRQTSVAVSNMQNEKFR